MIRILDSLMVSFLILLIVPQGLQAQEKLSLSTEEVEALRERLEAQEAQLRQLRESLQRQEKLIEQQQRLLEALQRKLESGNAVNSTLATQERPGAARQVKPEEEKTLARPAPRPPQNVEAGYGKIRFNGVLQGWYTAGNGGFRDTFRLRRAQFRFSGEITPQVKWTMMIDAAKALAVNNTFTTINGTRVATETSINQVSRMLQDAYITLDYIKNVRIDVGQFKVPMGLEMQTSGTALDTVERALFTSDRTRPGSFGTARDIGVRLSGPLTAHADYQLALLNGSGEHQNDADRNDQKALSGRLILRPPVLAGLQIGASGVWGNGTRPDRPRRDRLGGEMLLARGPFKFQSELMTGKDNDFHRMGYYAHFGYKLNPKLEAIFRFDVFDPDTRRETNANNVTERDYVAGFNYFITENRVKLQANYVRRTFHNAIAPARHLLLVNLQTSW